MMPRDSSPSAAELEAAIALYEQAITLDGSNPTLKARLGELRTRLDEARASARVAASKPQPPAAGAPPNAQTNGAFSKATPTEIKDPDEIRRAIQAYRQLASADPGNREVAAKLRYLEDRLKALFRPHRSIAPKGVRRARVDML